MTGRNINDALSSLAHGQIKVNTFSPRYRPDFENHIAPIFRHYNLPFELSSKKDITPNGTGNRKIEEVVINVAFPR